MNKPTMIVSGLALLVALTTLGLVLNLSQRLEKQSASMQATLTGIADRTDKSLGEVKSTLGTGLDTMGAKVDQQSMLVNRALGKVIPLVLPSDVLAKMADIESQLSDESTWPKNSSEIQKLNERLASVVNSLPPWAQEELLPQMVPRRWEIDSLWFLANSEQATESSRMDQASAVEALLTQKPPSASDRFADKLRERQREILADIRLQEKTAAIAAATEALDGRGDYDTAIRMLAACEKDGEVTEIAGKMQAALTHRAFSGEMDSIQKLLDFADTAESRTKEYTLGRAEQMIVDVRMRMGALSIRDKSLLDRVEGLQRRAEAGLQVITTAKQKREADSVKAYQKWALQQIKQVQEYDAVADREIAKIEGKIERNNPLSGARTNASRKASATIRDELIRLMGPINQGLLDEAVNQLFRKVYQSRFDKLNKDDQLAVIEAFAVATKRSLD